MNEENKILVIGISQALCQVFNKEKFELWEEIQKELLFSVGEVDFCAKLLVHAEENFTENYKSDSCGIILTAIPSLLERKLLTKSTAESLHQYLVKETDKFYEYIGEVFNFVQEDINNFTPSYN